MIIDQLPLLGGDVQGTDEFPIERGTTTYKTTQAALIKPATDAAAAAQAAADDAQLAADNAQDTADEANAKGLPPGGTAGQVLTKASSADYSASWENPSGGDVTADMLGIVIDGNSTPVGASAGQYVIVKNSTISGITDGLYTAAQTIPANTAIDSTYLRAVSNGGLNSIATNVYSLSAAANVTLSTYTCVIVASKMCVFQFEITANAEINAFTSVVTGFPAPQELANIIGLNNDYTFSQFYVDNLGKPNAGHLRTRTRIPSGTVVRFTATYAL